MDVVPARVADAGPGRTVGDRLLVGDPQGVEVGAERDPPACPARHGGTNAGGRTRGVDVAEQPGARGQNRGPESGHGETVHDRLGRPDLLPSGLRMSVQVPTEGDQLVGTRLGEPVDLGRGF